MKTTTTLIEEIVQKIHIMYSLPDSHTLPGDLLTILTTLANQVREEEQKNQTDLITRLGEEVKYMKEYGFIQVPGEMQSPGEAKEIDIQPLIEIRKQTLDQVQSLLTTTLEEIKQ